MKTSQNLGGAFKKGPQWQPFKKRLERDRAKLKRVPADAFGLENLVGKLQLLLAGCQSWKKKGGRTRPN